MEIEVYLPSKGLAIRIDKNAMPVVTILYPVALLRWLYEPVQFDRN